MLQIKIRNQLSGNNCVLNTSITAIWTCGNPKRNSSLVNEKTNENGKMPDDGLSRAAGPNTYKLIER